MKKAALFFDIDGTILSEKTKEIPIFYLSIQGELCARFRHS